MNASITAKEIELDYQATEREVLAFIRNVVKESSAKGVVVGLSGGVDSAVVGALCVRAIGPDNVIGVLLPASHTPKADTEDARMLAKMWGIRTYEAPIDKAFEALTASLPLESGRVAQANVKARTRMILLYFVANNFSMLVAGTGDRSEDSLGYFTKWGDGGVDFLPISHLYKTQVRALGAHLGLPASIVSKPASPQLWPGHRATDEIPLDYDVLDLVLHCLLDRKMSVESAAKMTGVPKATVQLIVEKHRTSQHKRVYPPMVKPW